MPRNFEIACLAEDQYGLVTTRQLTAIGICSSAIRQRVLSGRLFPVHRGVYAVGHRSMATRECQWMAAVLACGPGAALSHTSASLHWGTLKRHWLGHGRIHVSTSHRRRTPSNVALHWTFPLNDDDIVLRHNIPVTSIERTLVDLGDVLDVSQLSNVLHETQFHYDLDLNRLLRTMHQNVDRRALKRLRGALALNASGSAGCKSACEDRVYAHLLASSLPPPLVNTKRRFGHRILELDFQWPERKLCVEIDGGGHQRERTRREDAIRDTTLTAAGWTTLRFSAATIDRTPEVVVSAVRRHFAKLELLGV